jgi:hypothetical protein
LKLRSRRPTYPGNEQGNLPSISTSNLHTALETYRISKGAFTTDGIPSESELVEYLKEDTQILGLPAPVPMAKVFDFSCNAK